MSASRKSEIPLSKEQVPRLVAATNNQHKLSEIRSAVGPDFIILSLDDLDFREELAETKDTLEGNSLQKASFIFQRFNLPCFADDTGLEVEALEGAPGVYSARYAGEQKSSEDNINLLLSNLERQSNRKARFRAVITLLGFGEPKVFEGILSGSILPQRQGKGGFGYDPVFLPDGFSKSLAEMTMEEKNAISHRGLAVKLLVSFLKAQRRSV